MRTAALAGVTSLLLVVRSASAATELGAESYYVEDDSRSPAIGSNGSVHVLVWTDVREDEGELTNVRALRIAADGAAVGTPITVAGSADDEWRPAIASDGTDFLVVWEDAGSSGGSERNTIVASWLGAEGGVGAPIVLGTGTHPALAGRNGGYLVTWIAGAEEFEYPEVYGRRVSVSGAPMDPERIQIGRSNGVWDNDVSSNGTNFLVTWVDEVAIGGRIVHWNGELGEPRDLFQELDNPYSLLGASSASDGSGYLVAFACATCGDGWRGVGGVLLDGEAGSTADPVRIATNGSEPDVASLAEAYLVVWEDQRDASPEEPFPSNTDTWVARVAATGTLLDGGPDDGGFRAIEWGLTPHVSAVGDDALVMATRGDDVTGRTVSFATEPGPGDPPDDPPDDPGSDDPGGSGGPDAPLPRAPGQGEENRGGGCALTGERAPASLALLFAPALWLLRRRRLSPADT